MNPEPPNIFHKRHADELDVILKEIEYAIEVLYREILEQCSELSAEELNATLNCVNGVLNTLIPKSSREIMSYQSKKIKKLAIMHVIKERSKCPAVTTI